jgi:hypothetical protein
MLTYGCLKLNSPATILENDAYACVVTGIMHFGRSESTSMVVRSDKSRYKVQPQVITHDAIIIPSKSVWGLARIRSRKISSVNCNLFVGGWIPRCLSIAATLTLSRPDRIFQTPTIPNWYVDVRSTGKFSSRGASELRQSPDYCTCIPAVL